MIICQTPFRISFFGGGTDFPQWYENNSGSVISASINKFSYITARDLPNFFDFKYRLRYFKTEEVKELSKINHPTFREIISKYHNKNRTIEIVHNADLPAMSGLGSSSSTTVGTIHALMTLNNRKVSKKSLAYRAIEIEQEILKESVGSQDQVVASYGGFNFIKFNRDKSIIVKPFTNLKNIKKIEDSLLLVFTGIKRKAEKIERDKIKNFNKSLNYFSKLDNLTLKAKELIESNNFKLKNFGELLSENWEIKKKLSSMVTNSNIDRIYNIGMKNGAYGGKLLGAGNGGFVLFICNSKSKKKIKQKLRNYLNVPTKFETTGSRIVKYI
jgi:D-glycero-alpha-D-manno-heptose-7-phosphate kinase